MNGWKREHFLEPINSPDAGDSLLRAQPMEFIAGNKWAARAFVAFAIVAMIAVVAIGAIDIWYCRSILREIDAHAYTIDSLSRHDRTVDAILESHKLARIAPDGATDVPNPER